NQHSTVDSAGRVKVWRIVTGHRGQELGHPLGAALTRQHLDAVLRVGLHIPIGDLLECLMPDTTPVDPDLQICTSSSRGTARLTCGSYTWSDTACQRPHCHHSTAHL